MFAREKQNKQAEKEKRAAHRDYKEKIKTRGDWTREAQTAFNAFIRARDSLQPCISCDRHHNGQYHAGHYRSVGSAAHLRFNELNVHKQCAPCNNHLSGNLISYRVNLIKKIGINSVEELEQDNKTTKWSIDYIKSIKKIYKAKLKELNA
jgi:hypothetical protein